MNQSHISLCLWWHNNTEVWEPITLSFQHSATPTPHWCRWTNHTQLSTLSHPHTTLVYMNQSQSAFNTQPPTHHTGVDEPIPLSHPHTTLVYMNQSHSFQHSATPPPVFTLALSVRYERCQWCSETLRIAITTGRSTSSCVTSLCPRELRCLTGTKWLVTFKMF